MPGPQIDQTLVVVVVVERLDDSSVVVVLEAELVLDVTVVAEDVVEVTGDFVVLVEYPLLVVVSLFPLFLQRKVSEGFKSLTEGLTFFMETLISSRGTFPFPDHTRGF